MGLSGGSPSYQQSQVLQVFPRWTSVASYCGWTMTATDTLAGEAGLLLSWLSDLAATVADTLLCAGAN